MLEPSEFREGCFEKGLVYGDLLKFFFAGCVFFFEKLLTTKSVVDVPLPMVEHRALCFTMQKEKIERHYGTIPPSVLSDGEHQIQQWVSKCWVFVGHA